MIREQKEIEMKLKVTIWRLYENTSVLDFYMRNCNHVPAYIRFDIIDAESGNKISNYQDIIGQKNKWDNRIVKDYGYHKVLNAIFVYV